MTNKKKLEKYLIRRLNKEIEEKIEILEGLRLNNLLLTLGIEKTSEKD